MTITDEEYEIARKSIEDVLIDFRDARISILNVGNGLVCREKDGTPSSSVRLTTLDALHIGIDDAINKARAR